MSPGGRTRAIGTRAPMAQLPNQRWSSDLVSDQLTDGHRFGIVTVVDDFTRDCLALIADTSLSGALVVRELVTLRDARPTPPILALAGKRPPPWPKPLPRNLQSCAPAPVAQPARIGKTHTPSLAHAG